VKGLYTEIVSVYNESKDEFRVHRRRVLLSLIGVMIAVFAVTLVTGFGNVVRQVNLQWNDAEYGRPASYAVSAGEAGDSVNASDFDAAMRSAMQRYKITYGSPERSLSATVQLDDGVDSINLRKVDQIYGKMRSLTFIQGGWFEPDDADRLAPAIVINKTAWENLGSPDLARNPVITLTQPNIKAVIIGVVEAMQYGPPAMTGYVLAESFNGVTAGVDGAGGPGGAMGSGDWTLWLPPENGDQIMAQIASDLQGQFGTKPDFYRTDYLAGGIDPLAVTQALVNTVAIIVMVLGTVGYVNLAIVTVRARIREIGIRRAFGATSGRVFVSVLLESVVGTVLAGMIGVAGALMVLQIPMVQEFMTAGMPLANPAQSPIEAAIAGMSVSILAGLLAGLMPALVATRVDLIDAIRAGA